MNSLYNTPNNETIANTRLSSDLDQIIELPEIIHPFCTYEKILNRTGTHEGQKNAFKYLCRMASANQAYGCMDTTHAYEASKHNVSAKTISNWDSRLEGFGFIEITRTGRGSERTVTDTGFQFVAWSLGQEKFVGYHKKKEVLISTPSNVDENSCSDHSSDQLIDKQPPIPYTDTEISNNVINLKTLEEPPPVDNCVTVEKILNTLSASYNLLEIDKLAFKRFADSHAISSGQLSYAWATFIAYSTDFAVGKPLGLMVKYLQRGLEFGLIFEALTEEQFH